MEVVMKGFDCKYDVELDRTYIYKQSKLQVDVTGDVSEELFFFFRYFLVRCGRF